MCDDVAVMGFNSLFSFRHFLLAAAAVGNFVVELSSSSASYGFGIRSSVSLSSMWRVPAVTTSSDTIALAHFKTSGTYIPKVICKLLLS